MSARDLPTLSTLTREDLVRRLVSDGVKRSDAAKMITVIFESLCAALVADEDVQVRSFGRFSVVNKKTRPVRNPKTGEPLALQARRTVTFRPSAVLRARITATLCCAAERRQA
jgi:integration host factor subunit alpha